VGVALSPDERDRLILAAMKLRMDVSTFIRLMTLPDTDRMAYGIEQGFKR
jgi:hypothetical protein